MKKILVIAFWCALFTAEKMPAASNEQTLEPMIAAHYFGEHWPKNFLSAFRREYVLKDFQQLRKDGFNTVILLVSWGDFQPVIAPCCQWNERAFTRLQFLIDAAAQADLRVILRVGYGWSLNPHAEAPLQRIHQLLNDAATRVIFLKFIERLGRSLENSPQVILTMMSWEDQWLHQIDPAAQTIFEDFTSLLPAGTRPPLNAPLPTANGINAALFHAYWDWLVMTQLYQPAQKLLPNLSYEIRIDKDPVKTGENQPMIWLDHRAMYRQTGNAPVSIYWAPFWGAENVGEQLSAARSNELLAALLRETRAFSGQRAIFIDQFNVIDNSLGYEHNAILAPNALDDFLNTALCTLKQQNVIGYGYWTTRDYRESPLYNPSFSLGLDGWKFTSTNSAALKWLPNEDAELQLATGDVLEQTITSAAGRLPTSLDSQPDQVCIAVGAASVGSVTITAGNLNSATQLRFTANTNPLQCTAIVAAPYNDQLTLRIAANSETTLQLRSIWFFDHIQHGGLYDVDGNHGELYHALVQFNRNFKNKHNCR
ncbi:hypothetical protein [Chromatium okenii]|uniref:Glycoside hydrolase family 42 N-terminal domain-containing protein n=1 Tax=Chromatium okenii TaxID=61644 RepID=A0A2S7XUI4_9GAMM|nr:hypothetical protein [Chromatium okenii]PQJ97316.1 hypothetical protein CXB77_01915 [Chromatium okenii]